MPSVAKPRSVRYELGAENQAALAPVWRSILVSWLAIGPFWPLRAGTLDATSVSQAPPAWIGRTDEGRPPTGRRLPR